VILPVLLAVVLVASPSPAPVCDKEVSLTSLATVDYASAKARHLGPVDVTVHVDVGADGTVREARIVPSGSSHDVVVDQIAMRAAVHSTYAPKIVDCTAVRAEYLFKLSFE
jgi:TonB family protein